MSELTEEQIEDLKILARFIVLFCHARHDRNAAGERALPEILQQGKGPKQALCAECAELLDHGMKKRAACPLDPKPTCKSCYVHCYTPEQRLKVREIMAYSGKRMMLRGRLDYLWHYFIKR